MTYRSAVIFLLVTVLHIDSISGNEPRKWNSADEMFSVDATFKRFAGSKVVLEKVDGEEVSVALADLAKNFDDPDIQYLCDIVRSSALARPRRSSTRSFNVAGESIFAKYRVDLHAHAVRLTPQPGPESKSITFPLDLLSDEDLAFLEYEAANGADFSDDCQPRDWSRLTTEPGRFVIEAVTGDDIQFRNVVNGLAVTTQLSVLTPEDRNAAFAEVLRLIALASSEAKLQSIYDSIQADTDNGPIHQNNRLCQELATVEPHRVFCIIRSLTRHSLFAESPAVRKSVILAMTKLPHPSIDKVLHGLLADNDSEVREAAQRALQSLPPTPPQVVELRTAVQKAVESERRLAAKSLLPPLSVPFNSIAEFPEDYVNAYVRLQDVDIADRDKWTRNRELRSYLVEVRKDEKRSGSASNILPNELNFLIDENWGKQLELPKDRMLMELWCYVSSETFNNQVYYSARIYRLQYFAISKAQLSQEARTLAFAGQEARDRFAKELKSAERIEFTDVPAAAKGEVPSSLSSANREMRNWVRFVGAMAIKDRPQVIQERFSKLNPGCGVGAAPDRTGVITSAHIFCRGRVSLDLSPLSAYEELTHLVVTRDGDKTAATVTGLKNLQYLSKLGSLSFDRVEVEDEILEAIRKEAPRCEISHR